MSNFILLLDEVEKLVDNRIIKENNKDDGTIIVQFRRYLNKKEIDKIRFQYHCWDFYKEYGNFIFKPKEGVIKIQALIDSGDIKLGMTKGDLRILMNESPHDYSIPTRNYPEPSIWVYHDIEFTFKTEKGWRVPYPGPSLIYVTCSHPIGEKTLLGG